MSVALSIVEIAEREARKEKADNIKSIELEIGQLSGVVIDALKFAMDSAVKNTMLQHSNVHIHFIPGLCQCEVCKHKFESSEIFSLCDHCGSADINVLKGNELRVKALVIE